jgi:preprotein translocase subunit SecA
MIGFFKKIIGDKATRDMKEINPYLKKIKEAYEHIKTLSNDELRAKTLEFKEKITGYIKEEEDEIARLEKQIEEDVDLDINVKEDIYKQIDKLKKRSYEKSQEILNEILPEAFSVMKETARRFKENEYVEVTANEFDKELAAKYDNVTIKGDKAYYKNQWMAGGNLITWDMVH